MSTPARVLTPCPSCGARLGVPSTAAGKKIRCPKCQTIVAITAEMVTPPPEMVAPPASVPQPAQRPDVSLGGEKTFAGAPQKKYAPESLGDQATFGGGRGDADDHFTDKMEIVDLAGRYKVEGLLGKGGMGEVQLATDTRLNRKVAIKRMLGDAAKSRTAVSRFLIEAKSIAALNHPNIVQIYDYGRDNDGPFLILEYVDGNSLLDKCQGGALSLELAVDLTCQLCDGLGKAHESGIIHRDIKPANVLMTKDGVPKLTDFGLAKDEASDGGLSMAGAVLGTLDFMPPEQRKDVSLTDARSDLWSLAATLYQMVTGEPPRVIDLDEVPQELRQTLAKALKAKKEERYQTAVDFSQALRGSRKATAIVHDVSVDLHTGECPKCHAKNEATRKFCRECASPLRVNCLTCRGEIPVWEKVCGECGGKQSDLVAAYRASLDGKREQAEALRSQYGFSTAIEIAQEIAGVVDSRLQHLKGWAQDFVSHTQLEWTLQQDSAAQHFLEARSHRTAYDYSSAIQAMELIPAAMRTPEMGVFLQALLSDHEEASQLEQSIAHRVKERNLDGLLEQVNRALTLIGDRADLVALQRQITERNTRLRQQRNEAFSAAKDLLKQGHARDSFLRIQPWLLNNAELPASDQELVWQLEAILHSEDELWVLVKESNADGVLEPEEVVRLVVATIRYLQINPHHEKILGMKDQLITRIKKQPERFGRWSNVLLGMLPFDAQVLLSWGNSVGIPFRDLAAFSIGVYPVTQSQYQKVMGCNPSTFAGANEPVEMISWHDAIAFCRKLSALPAEQTAGRVYRLPNEAEWQHACRAGTTTIYSFGDDAKDVGDYAWFKENSGGTTHQVGCKLPNAWGLHDMHGNVWEWCSDQTGSENRVIRGGSWDAAAAYCRTVSHFSNIPSLKKSNNIGFRLALSFPARQSGEVEQNQ